jgi:NACalpha-BTF3-like transcription factor
MAAKGHPINELICRVFYSRNVSHLEHWKTDSYAKHEALGDFYDEVIDKLDAVVELFQGLYSKVNFVEEEEEEEEGTKDILACLQDDVKWIIKNYGAISNNNDAIENLLQELVDLYGTTIYKLRFLS